MTSLERALDALARADTPTEREETASVYFESFRAAIRRLIDGDGALADTKLEAKNAALEAENTSLLATLEDNTDALEAGKETRRKCQEDLDWLREDLNRALQTTRDQSEEITVIEGENEELVNTLQAARAREAECRAALEAQQDSIDALQQKVNDTQTGIAQVRELVDETIARANTQLVELEDARREVGELTAALRECQRKTAALKAENETLVATRDEGDDQLRELEAANELQRYELGEQLTERRDELDALREEYVLLQKDAQTNPARRTSDEFADLKERWENVKLELERIQTALGIPDSRWVEVSPLPRLFLPDADGNLAPRDEPASTPLGNVIDELAAATAEGDVDDIVLATDDLVDEVARTDASSAELAQADKALDAAADVLATEAADRVNLPNAGSVIAQYKKFVNDTVRLKTPTANPDNDVEELARLQARIDLLVLRTRDDAVSMLYEANGIASEPAFATRNENIANEVEAYHARLGDTTALGDADVRATNTFAQLYITFLEQRVNKLLAAASFPRDGELALSGLDSGADRVTRETAALDRIMTDIETTLESLGQTTSIAATTMRTPGLVTDAPESTWDVVVEQVQQQLAPFLLAKLAYGDDIASEDIRDGDEREVVFGKYDRQVPEDAVGVDVLADGKRDDASYLTNQLLQIYLSTADTGVPPVVGSEFVPSLRERAGKRREDITSVDSGAPRRGSVLDMLIEQLRDAATRSGLDFVPDEAAVWAEFNMLGAWFTATDRGKTVPLVGQNGVLVQRAIVIKRDVGDDGITWPRERLVLAYYAAINAKFLLKANAPADFTDLMDKMFNTSFKLAGVADESTRIGTSAPGAYTVTCKFVDETNEGQTTLLAAFRRPFFVIERDTQGGIEKLLAIGHIRNPTIRRFMHSRASPPVPTVPPTTRAALGAALAATHAHPSASLSAKIARSRTLVRGTLAAALDGGDVAAARALMDAAARGLTSRHHIGTGLAAHVAHLVGATGASRDESAAKAGRERADAGDFDTFAREYAGACRPRTPCSPACAHRYGNYFPTDTTRRDYAQGGIARALNLYKRGNALERARARVFLLNAVKKSDRGGLGSGSILGPVLRSRLWLATRNDKLDEAESELAALESAKRAVEGADVAARTYGSLPAPAVASEAPAVLSLLTPVLLGEAATASSDPALVARVHELDSFLESLAPELRVSVFMDASAPYTTHVFTADGGVHLFPDDGALAPARIGTTAVTFGDASTRAILSAEDWPDTNGDIRVYILESGDSAAVAEDSLDLIADTDLITDTDDVSDTDNDDAEPATKTVVAAAAAPTTSAKETGGERKVPASSLVAALLTAKSDDDAYDVLTRARTELVRASTSRDAWLRVADSAETALEQLGLNTPDAGAAMALEELRAWAPEE